MMPNSISSSSSSSIWSGVGTVSILLSAIFRASERYSSACACAGEYSMTVIRRSSARCTWFSRGTKSIICVPSRFASASMRSASRSVLRELQMRPASRTLPVAAYLRMPRAMLFAAYIAIISPETTM